MAFWDDWFGGGDAYDEAGQYLNEYKPMLEGYYNPYIEYGNRAMPTLEQQYAMLLNNPSALYSSLGSNYQSSPGYQFALDEALRAGNQSAAAGGMLGTPAHTQQNMATASQYANQDFNNYMSNMLNMYNQGLSGTQNQFNTGYGATNQLAGGMGNLYGSQANLAFNKGASSAAGKSSLLGAGIGALGAIGGSMLMPGAGTAAGAALGQQLGQGMGSSNGWKPDNRYMMNFG